MRRSASLAPHALEFRKEAEDAVHLHLLVESALFGEVPDLIEDPWVGIGAPEQGDRPGVRGDDVQDHPNAGGLAGAVGAEQTVDGPGGDGERQGADCRVLRVSFGDPSNVEREVGHRVRCWYHSSN